MSNGAMNEEQMKVADLLEQRARDRQEALVENGRFSKNDIFPGMHKAGDVVDTVQQVPVDLIDDPSVPQRWHYSEDSVGRMVASLIEQGDGNPLEGQIQAVILLEKADGRYEMIEGLTRLKAFRFLRATHIKAVIQSGLDSQNAYAIGYRCNEERNPLTAYDKGMSFARLLENGVFPTQEALGVALNVGGRSALSGYLSFSKLPPAAIAIIDGKPEKFSYNVGARLLTLWNKTNDESLVCLAAKKIASEEWTQEKLFKYVSGIETDKNKEKHKKREFKLINGGKIRYGEGTIGLDSVIPVPVGQEERIARALQEAFEIVMQQIAQEEQAQS